MVRGDAAQLSIRGIRADAAEEDAHLGFPLAEIGAQDRDLLVVGKLAGHEPLGMPPQAQLPFSRHAKVSHPLGVTTRRNEVLDVVQGQQVDRRGAPLTALPPANGEDPGAVDAEPLLA